MNETQNPSNPSKNFNPYAIGAVVLLVVIASVYFYSKKGTGAPYSSPVTNSNPATSTSPDLSPATTTGSVLGTTGAPKPAVSNVVFKPHTNFSTNPYLSWKTDKSVKTKVFYDTQSIILLSSASTTIPEATHGLFVVDPSYTTVHAFEFPGLIHNTTYHYVIESVDKSGNFGIFVGAFKTDL